MQEGQGHPLLHILPLHVLPAAHTKDHSAGFGIDSALLALLDSVSVTSRKISGDGPMPFSAREQRLTRSARWKDQGDPRFL